MGLDLSRDMANELTLAMIEPQTAKQLMAYATRMTKCIQEPEKAKFGTNLEALFFFSVLRSLPLSWIKWKLLDGFFGTAL